MISLRARFYNSDLGRFHTLDEYEGRTGEPLSLHKYLYAHANPVTAWDPSGRMLSLGEMAAVSATIGFLAGLSIPSISHSSYDGVGFSERFMDCMVSNGGCLSVFVMSVAFGVDASIPQEFALIFKDPWEIHRGIGKPKPYTSAIGNRITILKRKLIKQGMGVSRTGKALQALRQSAGTITKIKTAAVVVGALFAGYTVGIVPGCAIAASTE